MSFDWPYYLDVAKELTEQKKDTLPGLQEARYRAAISRAYYAVFGRARHYLRHVDRIEEPSNEGTHYHVIDIFKKSKDEDRKLIGILLDGMRKDRNAADYYLHHHRLKGLAKRAKRDLKQAKEIFRLLDLIQEM